MQRRIIVLVITAIVIFGGVYLINSGNEFPTERPTNPNFPVQWQPLSHTDGGFQILAPGVATRHQEPSTTADGHPTVCNFHKINRPELPALFYVAIVDFPGIPTQEPQQLLQDMCHALCQARIGKMVNLQPILLNKHPGCQAVIEYEERGRSNVMTCPGAKLLTSWNKVAIEHFPARTKPPSIARVGPFCRNGPLNPEQTALKASGAA